MRQGHVGRAAADGGDVPVALPSHTIIRRGANAGPAGVVLTDAVECDACEVIRSDLDADAGAVDRPARQAKGIDARARDVLRLADHAVVGQHTAHRDIISRDGFHQRGARVDRQVVERGNVVSGQVLHTARKDDRPAGRDEGSAVGQVSLKGDRVSAASEDPARLIVHIAREAGTAARRKGIFQQQERT